MDREIEFRGKELENDEWVCGWYVREGTDFIIYQSESSEIGVPPGCSGLILRRYEVDPKTIGQFTGLSECERLYEGDVVEYENDGEKKRAKITYSGYTASFRLENITDYKSAMDIPFHIWNGRGGLTKIGNIHDNPELEE